ncbi:DUF5050 domain-containing protein [Anaeromicrobium sediminis]|uniref:Prolow-density lipoprotein receptor-related protein 1-like beta-propeller domain-containing protein n=1 Tax=Anaeromicrobium sediminis TaxID=1478221 RepID=A0A267MNP8_9FIRM|nr:DUF5050 domain-containing protein [Anaeromicrobium sediminis]PAB61047.1 hypothetical protein CCE28_01050 [Anaeromicrobium sediminis]
MKMNKKKKIVIFLALSIILFGLYSMFNTNLRVADESVTDQEIYISKDAQCLPSSGNIANGANVIEHEGYKYYIDFAIGNRLVRESGNQIDQLTSGNINNFVLYDNKIFYLKMDGKLFKIKLLNIDNMKDRELVNTPQPYVYVHRGILYYFNDNNILISYDFESKQINKVASNMYNVNNGYPLFKDNYIYFLNPLNDNKIYRVNINEGKYEKIDEVAGFKINGDDKKLYVYKDRYAYSLNYDGSDKELLMDEVAYNLIVGKNYIFWNLQGDRVVKQDKEKLTRKILDLKIAGQRIGVAEDKFLYGNIIDIPYMKEVDMSKKTVKNIDWDKSRILAAKDRVFYYNEDDSLNSFDLDTMQSKNYNKNGIRKILGFNDNVIYHDNDENYKQLYMTDLNSGTTKIIANDDPFIRRVTNDGIYYEKNLGEGKKVIKKLSLDGSKNIEVANGYYQFIVDDWLYYEKAEGLYRIKEGKSEQRIIDHKVNKKAKYKEGIIYSEDSSLYKVNYDGSNSEKILDIKEPMIFEVFGSSIYYLKKKNREDD